MAMTYKRGTYFDGTTAIMAYEDWQPFANISVNLADYGMKPKDENHIFVPAHNFDETFIATLFEDILEEKVRDIRYGWGTGFEAKLKDNWKEICE